MTFRLPSLIAHQKHHHKRKLNELYCRKVKPRATAFVVWDTLQRGLVLRVQPSSRRSFNVIYNRHGRTRWLHLADADSIGLSEARQLAAEAMLEVARGNDPASEKRAKRSSGTFAELADRYLEYAKHEKKNKSWEQGRALVVRYALPRWKSMQAVNINRSDVKALMASFGQRKVLANAVLSSVSAIFRWAVSEAEILLNNPCKMIVRNKEHARERVLSDTEVALFFKAFDDIGDTVVSAALKTVLLTGQRGGEVRFLRREHLKDGWWELPGAPVPALGWPGLKNKQNHRVWVPQAVQKLIAEQGDGATGFVFSKRGRAVSGLDQAMRTVCTKLKVERATPHDLRRTFSSKVTALGFGRDAMNRVTNHKEGGIADVYDRHQYEDENKRIMEAVASKLLLLAGVALPGNVLAFSTR